MAEATLGGDVPRGRRGDDRRPVDRHALEHDRVAAPSVRHDADAGVRRLAFARPSAAAASSLRIVDPRTGGTRGDREVGELELRSPSVTPGYYRNPEATAATFHDGWLRTGDLAYLRRRPARGVRTAEGRDHRRRPQRVPGGRRARRRHGRGRPRRERDRVRQRPQAWARVDRRRRRDQEPTSCTRCTTRWSTTCATRWACPRSRWCWCARARCPRRRRGSCSARSAVTATTTTSSNRSESSGVGAFGRRRAASPRTTRGTRSRPVAGPRSRSDPRRCVPRWNARCGSSRTTSGWSTDTSWLRVSKSSTG